MPPYVSLMCSLSIISASAETTSFASSPRMLRLLFATMNPRESARSTTSFCGAPFVCQGAVPPPNWYSSLWFQPGGDAQGAEPARGSARTLKSYRPRSIAPCSERTMYGTVTPWSVVVDAIDDAAGGDAGSYAWNVCVVAFI